MHQLPGTILIVDDEPKVRRLLADFFSLRGLQTITVGSGEEALQALAQHPHVVLLDIKMPGMDGITTLKRLRAQAPNLSVIMISAIDEEAMVREALAAGAYDYVTKPFDLEYLETMVLTKVLLGMKG